MPRRRTFNIFQSGREAGPYDEAPCLPDQFDVQLHLSRNDRPQPFFLICDHDTLLLQMSGEGQVQFKGTSVLNFCVEPGDYVYVPAGTPHRFVPSTESIQLRYKSLAPQLEGVCWFCPSCDRQLWRTEWELASELPQEGYWRACTEFNAGADLRHCSACGSVHPEIDLSGFRWQEIAAQLRADTEPAPATA